MRGGKSKKVVALKIKAAVEAGDPRSLEELCTVHGITSATYRKWAGTGTHANSVLPAVAASVHVPPTPTHTLPLIPAGYVAVVLVPVQALAGLLGGTP